MVSIRHFTDKDAYTLRMSQFPDMTDEETLNLVHDWNSFSYQGKYFEIFAVLSGKTIVGSASLYQHTQSVASLGVEIYESFRRSGFAYEAILLLLDHAKQLGYKIIQDQVRTDNKASILLHEKLLFETDQYIYRNKKDQPCYLFLMPL